MVDRTVDWKDGYLALKKAGLLVERMICRLVHWWVSLTVELMAYYLGEKTVDVTDMPMAEKWVM